MFKTYKSLSILIVAASLLLSACSGLNVSFAAPAAVTNSPAAASPAQTQPVAQAIPVSQSAAPAQTQPIEVAPQVLDLQNAYQAVYANVNPSVVNIQISAVPTTSSRGSRGTTQSQTPVPVAEGSGFVWDSAGHIVTNNHVVEGADKISVTFSDGTTVDAKLVGADPNSDLAVIQVSLPAGVKPIPVADSSKVKVGQIVIAIGNPFGLAGTMTTGIVSAVSRSIQAGSSNSNGLSTTPRYSIPDIIQTDAAINPGNSGGVLLDLQGSVIGVPSQIESSTNSNSGVGFAIPSAILQKVVPSLISKGSFARSYLGISGGTLTADLVATLKLNANQKGVVVMDVTANGPAAKAGLQGSTSTTSAAGSDVITAIDGQAVNRFEDLVSYLFSHTDPGQTVTLTILRAGSQQTVKVVLGTQPSA